MFETESKTVPITKEMVRAACHKVKFNQGSAGVDKESLEVFQRDLSGNLYKIWNRLASGSYYPQPVKEVQIPKSNGGKRKLGIPTVSYRIAQQVIKSYLEPPSESKIGVGLGVTRTVVGCNSTLYHYQFVIDLTLMITNIQLQLSNSNLNNS